MKEDADEDIAKYDGSFSSMVYVCEFLMIICYLLIYMIILFLTRHLLKKNLFLYVSHACR